MGAEPIVKIEPGPKMYTPADPQDEELLGVTATRKSPRKPLKLLKTDSEMALAASPCTGASVSHRTRAKRVGGG